MPPRKPARIDADEPFDPARYLSKVGGSDYLEVRWRLVWMRDRHPNATIMTDAYAITDQRAVFKAHITLPDGAEAMGWGSETPGDFRDYIEKAETKAIGRALAALGFGTQFAPDHDFGAAHGRVVDAPVRRHTAPVPQERADPVEAAEQTPDAPAADDAKISRTLLDSIRLTAKIHGVNPARLDARVQEKFGRTLSELTMGEGRWVKDQFAASAPVEAAS